MLEWKQRRDKMCLVIKGARQVGKTHIIDKFAREDVFKVYMRDTGLLMAMLEDGSQEDIIDGNLGIYKGAIYENIIADIMGKTGRKLYYYERDSKLEIDFIIRYNKQAVAVEVKSADNTKAKSMTSLLQSGQVKHGISDWD